MNRAVGGEQSQSCSKSGRLHATISHIIYSLQNGEQARSWNAPNFPPHSASQARIAVSSSRELLSGLALRGSELSDFDR